MKLTINKDLQCEIDKRKSDCQSEPAHCHITRNGIRVAKVWLVPVYIQPGHLLYNSEIKEVECFVCRNKYELSRAYERNRDQGND